MKRRRWGLVLIPFAVLAFGSSGAWAAGGAHMTQAQRECCGNLGDDSGLMPKECLLAHKFPCERFHFEVNLNHGEMAKDHEDQVEAAFQKQLGLRQREGCMAREWQGRCSPSASMLLASIGETGCAAAGCVEVEGVGEGAAVLAGDGADEAMLRAVVAQEVSWLRSYSEKRELSKRRKRLAKEQKLFLQCLELAAATEVGGQRNTEVISRLLAEAASKGFVGEAIDEAKKALARDATAKKAVAYARTIPANMLSALTKMLMTNKALSITRDRTIKGLAAQLDKVEQDADKTAKELQRKVMRLEESLDSSMASDRAARRKNDELVSSLRETEEHSQSVEAALGVCKEELNASNESILSTCSSELGELVEKSNSLVKFVGSKAKEATAAEGQQGQEQGDEQEDDVWEMDWAPVLASATIRKNFDLVHSITSFSMARLTGERDDLQRYSHQLLHDVNELLQRSSCHDDQLAVLEEDANNKGSELSKARVEVKEARAEADAMRGEMTVLEIRIEALEKELGECAQASEALKIERSSLAKDAGAENATNLEVEPEAVSSKGAQTGTGRDEEFSSLEAEEAVVEAATAVHDVDALHQRALGVDDLSESVGERSTPVAFEHPVQERSDQTRGSEDGAGSSRAARGLGEKGPAPEVAGLVFFAMKRRRWGLVLIPFAVLAFGSSGAWAAGGAHMTQAQRECCGNLGDDSGLMPKECLLAHKFPCERFHFEVNLNHGEMAKDHEDQVEAAFQKQLGLRQREGCMAREWQGRCSPSASMLLASIGETGCAAAGCVEVEGVGEGAAVLAGDGADEAMLRAVVAQEVSWLRSYSEKRELSKRRKRLAKEQKLFLQRLELAAATEVGGQRNTEVISRFLAEAASKGFVGEAIDEAKKALARDATAKKAVAYARTIPANMLSALTKMLMTNKAMSIEKDRIIEGLAAQLDKVEQDADKTAKELQRKVMRLEESLDSSMASDRAARRKNDHFLSSLRETQERSQSVEAELGLCKEELSGQTLDGAVLRDRQGLLSLGRRGGEMGRWCGVFRQASESDG
eukprot:g11512.t1